MAETSGDRGDRGDDRVVKMVILDHVCFVMFKYSLAMDELLVVWTTSGKKCIGEKEMSGRLIMKRRPREERVGGVDDRR